MVLMSRTLRWEVEGMAGRQLIQMMSAPKRGTASEHKILPSSTAVQADWGKPEIIPRKPPCEECIVLK